MDFVHLVIQFFNEAGWLANFLAILTFVVSCVLVFVRLIRPFLLNAKINKAISSDFESRWNDARAKEIIRIAIVDDQPADFPTAELKADGYQVQIYKQVTLAITAQLANYDIVFLDMKGVVKDDPENGGMKLIAELRRLNPVQKICAVSSKTFDINATEFFRQADDAKKKPLTAHECSTVINNFISELFSTEVLRDSADQAMSQLERKKRVMVMTYIRKFGKEEMTYDQLLENMSKTVGQLALRYRLINIVRAVAHVS